MSRKKTSNVEMMFVTNSLTGGGAERATNVLVNALFDEGIEVVLMVINNGPKDLVLPKCKVYEIGRNWQGTLLDTLKAFFKVQIIIFKINPSVIVLNCDLPEFLGSFLFYRGNVVVVEHAARPWPTRTFLGKVIRFIHRIRGANFVAVSSHLSIWPKAIAPVAVFPNAIDLSALRYSRKEISSGDTRLIHVGRLVESKQPEWVLEVSKRTDVPCVFIGVGPLENRMRDLSDHEAIEVEFLGQVADPYELFNPRDLLLISSQNEGDGLVLIEAVALRIPFLIYDIIDFAKFKIPSINKCQDIAEFEKKVMAYKRGEIDLQLGEQDRLRILQDRNPKFVAALWVDFFQNRLKS
jgi:glycosyltransferase involved in cell wall biosynthesis